MKRIAVLLVVLLMGLSLYGCGMKGAGTTSSSSSNNGSTSNPTGTPSGPVSAFTLNLVDNAARFVTAGTGTTASEARVIIRRYDQVASQVQVCTSYTFDANGDPACSVYSTQTVTTYSEVWKDIQDVSYAASISVGIPAGSGYTIDVITALYSNASGSYEILSYGTTSNVTIANNSSATISMNSVPSLVGMTVTDPSVAKGKLDITVNNTLPFNNAYQLSINYGGIIDIGTNPTNSVPMPTETISTSSNKITRDMPSSYTTGTINVSAQFTMNSAFLKSGESTTKWNRTFPDNAYGETAGSIFVPFTQVLVGI